MPNAARRRLAWPSLSFLPFHKPLAFALPDGSSLVAVPLLGASRAKAEFSHVESDARRLEQRQKKIEMGKNTLGYENYLRQVPKHRRKRGDPQTPDIHMVASKRQWDGIAKVRVWTGREDWSRLFRRSAGSRARRLVLRQGCVYLCVVAVADARSCACALLRRGGGGCTSGTPRARARRGVVRRATRCGRRRRAPASVSAMRGATRAPASKGQHRRRSGRFHTLYRRITRPTMTYTARRVSLTESPNYSGYGC